MPKVKNTEIIELKVKNFENFYSAGEKSIPKKQQQKF